MCVAYVSGNFMEDGGGEKNSGHFPQGGVSTRTHTHRPYLDLDFRKNVTWDSEAPKNVTWFKRTVTREIPGVTVRLAPEAVYPETVYPESVYPETV